jgi:hypothetical protein
VETFLKGVASGPKIKPCKVSGFEGLRILVTLNGSKSRQFKNRTHGQDRLSPIGQYPDVPLTNMHRLDTTNLTDFGKCSKGHCVINDNIGVVCNLLFCNCFVRCLRVN